MLVISRKESERFMLPDVGVTITLVALKGDKARIGIEAPQHVRVLREELLTEDTEEGRGERPTGA